MSVSPDPIGSAPSIKRLFTEIMFLCAAFAAVCCQLIFSDRETNYSQDELNYHVPAIRQIAHHWPKLDIAHDSLSATAPGYHYALATVSKLTGSDTRTLRFINWAVSATVLILLFIHLRHTLPPVDSALALLPLLLSNFFVKSASWVVTDNAALLLIAISFLSCLRAKGPFNWRLSLVNAGAVFVRQMSIWLIALPLATVAPEEASKKNPRQQLLRTCLFTAPPLAVLAFLFWSWGGLVPLVWRTASMRLSTAGPLYLLSVLGLLSPFYFWLPLGLSDIRRSKPTHRAIALASAAALFLWIVTASDANAEQGRWGGYLWNLSAFFPAIAARNILFLLLSQLGALSLVSIWSFLRNNGHARHSALFLLAIVTWASTFIVNRQVFHRYFEPTLLVLLIAMIPKLLAATAGRSRARLSWAVAACLQFAITLASAYRAIYN